MNFIKAIKQFSLGNDIKEQASGTLDNYINMYYDYLITYFYWGDKSEEVTRLWIWVCTRFKACCW